MSFLFTPEGGYKFDEGHAFNVTEIRLELPASCHQLMMNLFVGGWTYPNTLNF
jgi:hypothetical protein